MIGKSLSHYRIIEKLGQGGMGEVFLAEDSHLNRRVAIKVLPDAFARDPERLARFEREAKLLASLSHPNIAAIHGLEKTDGSPFLVMELVEGETLAQRIAKGPLAADEALEVCRQIAEGLECAHEKGIIHRDLKPANVKITPEGKVKILDFGLAKAFQEESASGDLSHSPTITEAMTRVGVILGTAAYMSPEQARGRPVDKRADIWAFGCVLYQCLTGKQAFDGETVTETLAAILKSEPDWDALPAAASWKVKDLLHRCLEKDPRRRLHDIADARIEIEGGLNEGGTSAKAAPEHAGRIALRSLSPASKLALSALILAGAVVGAMLWNLARPIQSASKPVIRFSVPLAPENQTWHEDRALTLSPDGSLFVYVAVHSGKSQLFLRRIDQLEGFPIAGTEGASGPFFSPNGAAVGFFAEGRLKKVSLADGSSVLICDDPGSLPHGAFWETSPDAAAR